MSALLSAATIGCDPEIFVSRDGEFLSAHGMVPGTKRNPHPVTDGTIQVDGTALEIGITPSASAADFLHNIKSVTAQLVAMLPDGFKLEYKPTAMFNPDYFKKLPKAAVELGCDPDYDAWTMMANPRPETDLPMRTASGHIHVGFTNTDNEFSDAHFERCAAIVRELDYYLGITSLSWDGDNTRRSLYGAAGAFRPKKYGLEYRVLSNAWLTSDELTVRVYSLVKECLTNIDKNISLVEEFGDTAVTIISNSDTNWQANYPDLAKRMKVLGVI